MRTWLRSARQSTWFRVVGRARVRWREVGGDQSAAAFAFFLLMSLVPLVLLLVTLGSLFVEREVATRHVVRLVDHYAPLTREQEHAAVTIVRGSLKARGGLDLVASVLSIWGALKFLRVLIEITNRIWRSQPYNWWRLPLKSLGLLGVTISAALVGVLLPGVARLVRQFLGTYLDISRWAFALIFGLIPWLVLFYGLILIYRLAPRRATRFSEVWLGALAATLLIWLGEQLFVVYAAAFASSNMLYGALGGLVAFLLWSYVSSCIGVFGICFCAAQVEIRQDQTQP